MSCPDALVQVREREEVELSRVLAQVLLDLRAQIAVGEREHAAVRVMDHGQLPGAEQALGNDDRAQRVAGPTAGVADHVGVALLKPERL